MPRLLAVLASLSLLVNSAYAISPKDEPIDSRIIERLNVQPVMVAVDHAASGPLADQLRNFENTEGGRWLAQFDLRTGRPHLIQGSGLPWLPGAGNALGQEALQAVLNQDGDLTLNSLEPMAREFIQKHRTWLLPQAGNLELNLKNGGIREEARLITLQFDWSINGVPVEGAQVFLRLNSGNLTQFGTANLGTPPTPISPTLTGEDAVRAVMNYSGDGELARLQDEPKLLWQAESEGQSLTYRLVYVVTYGLPSHIETWEGRVDATTGAVVSFRDTNHYARVTGGVYPRTVVDTEVKAPLPLAQVQTESGSVVADVAGKFAYSGGELQSGLDGSIFDTNCSDGCTNPPQANFTTEVGSGQVDFGFGGTDEVGNGISSKADRNAYFHMNQVRRIGLKWLPNLSWFDSIITVNVNIQDTCNATWGGNTARFFRSGGGCNNTGEIADVMQHEWGHGFDGNTQGGDGATGEATADVTAMSMTHSPLIGPHFRTDGSPVRNLDKDTTSKGLMTRTNVGSKCAPGTGAQGYAVHCEGEIYGQSHYDMAMSLVSKHGHLTGWRTAERIFFTSAPDSESYLPTGNLPIYDAYIQADDDDGNLTNGTPNGGEIYAAFDLHEIAGSPQTSSANCLRPEQPVVSVTPSCSQFDLSWNAIAGVDHYEIFRAPLVSDTAYFPVGEVPAGTTTFVDPDVAPGVDYYYVVMAVDGSGCESTVETPVFGRLTEQPIVHVTAAVSDDIPAGNRSGFPDPGEDVDLNITLNNIGTADALGVSGALTAVTPGVTILEGNDTWSDLPVGSSDVNQGILRFQTDDLQVACGDSVRFQLDVTNSSSCNSEPSYVDIRMGDIQVEYLADFEPDDGGFFLDTANSTATAGDWVYGDPDGSSFQPEDDATPDPGRFAWFTATNGGGDGTDDVDGGQTVLMSPTIDLSAFTEIKLSYQRWFANRDLGEDPDDYFIAEISNDDGATWATLENLDNNQSAAAWTEVEFDVEAFVTPTATMRLRFRVSDGTLDGNIIEAAIDEIRMFRPVCDDTPACFVEPTFDGLDSAVPGGSCAETSLSWSAASTNCQNAVIVYNVYRSTDPGFLPDATNLIAGGLNTLSYEDSLLEPGQTYYYIVRADDSRSGEDSNLNRIAVTAPTTPDLKPPVFDGLATISGGAGCGETVLSWFAASETCNAPVAYEVYRSTDPGFVPGPTNRIASTLSLNFTDAALIPGQSYSYVVRARDEAGNEDTNSFKLSTDSGILDEVVLEVNFEPDAGGWSVVAPNDAATGNWEWGDPEGTAYQPENDFTEGSGVNAWITGLVAAGGGGGNDIDTGTTTLLSSLYDLSTFVDPAIRYARWFTNDQGGSPGEDPLNVEISNDDGATWTTLESVNSGTPLEWVEVMHPVSPVIAPTAQMRVRFTASDLGEGSLVEAGIDGFDLVDLDQGCLGCPTPVNVVGTIQVNRVGDDIELDWSADPVVGSRFAIYKLVGSDFSEAIMIGTVDGKTFIHEGAALSTESFNYRISAIDECGNESALE